MLPDDESGELLGPKNASTSNGIHRGHPEVTRRRSPHSQSVSPSPLASPVPPLGPAPPYDHSNCSERMHRSCACVSFIAEHTKAREEATKVRKTICFVLASLEISCLLFFNHGDFKSYTIFVMSYNWSIQGSQG